MLSNAKTLLIISIWLSTGSQLAAQVLNRGQVIMVTPGAVIRAGEVDNRGQLSNQGNLYVTGNWSNTGTFSEANGTVHLIGTKKQTIRHNNQSFYHLVTAGGPKMIEDNLNITHRLDLTDALIEPTPNSIFLMRKTATIEGASSNAYFNGRLCWEGTHDRFYPVGTQNVYAPLWLTEEETAASATEPIVGINLVIPTATPEPDTTLDRISIVRHWERTVVQGEPQSQRAYAKLSILEDENMLHLDSVVVAGAEDFNKVFQNLGQSPGSASAEQITSRGYANARLLALGVLATPGKSGLIYVPNAFAPASAHREEQVFKVYGLNISPNGLQLTVYNRWGNIIFSSQSFEQITRMGWNGRNQNTQQEEVQGVYTYILNGRFNTGKTFKKTGTITLIR